MSEEHDAPDETGTLVVVEADEPYDSGNRQHVKKAQIVAKRRDASNRMVIRQLMGSREGRAWMYDILEECHVFTGSIFDADHSVMSCREGQRMIGLHIESAVKKACIERYIEMLKEANGDS